MSWYSWLPISMSSIAKVDGDVRAGDRAAVLRDLEREAVRRRCLVRAHEHFQRIPALRARRMRPGPGRPSRARCPPRRGTSTAARGSRGARRRATAPATTSDLDRHEPRAARRRPPAGRRAGRHEPRLRPQEVDRRRAPSRAASSPALTRITFPYDGRPERREDRQVEHRGPDPGAEEHERPRRARRSRSAGRRRRARDGRSAAARAPPEHEQPDQAAEPERAGADVEPVERDGEPARRRSARRGRRRPGSRRRAAAAATTPIPARSSAIDRCSRSGRSTQIAIQRGGDEEREAQLAGRRSRGRTRSSARAARARRRRRTSAASRPRSTPRGRRRSRRGRASRRPRRRP